MSYGRSHPTVLVPFTFVCEGERCGVVVTIQMDAGKDKDWESTVREAAQRMIFHCNWRVDPLQTPAVLCADCAADRAKGSE